MVEFSNEGKQSRDEKGIHISGTGYARQPVTFTWATDSTPGSLSDTQERIAETCDEIKAFLIDKNRSYGDSAIDPVRIFSKANPEEQIKVRIDDKLSRVARGDDQFDTDDQILDDLIGYFILLKVARDAS